MTSRKPNSKSRKRASAGALPLLAMMGCSCHAPLTAAFSTTLSPLIPQVPSASSTYTTGSGVSSGAGSSASTTNVITTDRTTISPRKFRIEELDSWEPHHHNNHHHSHPSSEGHWGPTMPGRPGVGLGGSVSGGSSSTYFPPSVGVTNNLSTTMSNHPFNRSTVSMPSWYPQYPHQKVTPTQAQQSLSQFQERLMTSSYLSPSEIDTLVQAIDISTGGDAYKIVGVMEFIKILVDTMEMGVDTIVAASFHYCSCFSAKEAFVTYPSTLYSQVDIWDQVHAKEGDYMKMFSKEARQIAQDAALLKRTEMVSASISSGEEFDSYWVGSTNGGGGSVRPDRMDSINMRFLLVSEAQNWKSLAIRSAACLYRLKGIVERRIDLEDNLDEVSPLDVRVAREALYIYAPLASRLGMHRLKNDLENTAFRILYRRQYEAVMAMTHNQELNHVLQSITEDVTDLLYEDASFSKYAQSVKVTARVKEPYSLWRKMKKVNAKSLLDVPDVLALRVVLNAKKMKEDEPEEVTRSRDVELCHYAQQLCIMSFPTYKGGRFKDYIAKPKANGYQSLHCTALKEMDSTAWPFEIQVRSSLMHQVAEFGLAAHWNYKEHGKSSNESVPYGCRQSSHEQKDDAYLDSRQEWENQTYNSSHDPTLAYSTPSSTEEEASEQDNERRARFLASEESRAPYLAALMSHKQNITREKVYIFLKSSEDSNSTNNSSTRRVGKLLDLPAGSCVLDAIRESERTLGWTVSLRDDAWLNDEVVSATQKLCNGDIVTIKGDFVSNGSLFP